MNRHTFSIVMASTLEGGIGHQGSIPWRLPGDLRQFRQLTSTTLHPSKHNAVIMGRKTWESLPPERKPLPGRQNYVLSRKPQENLPSQVIAVQGLRDALRGF